MGIYNCSSQYMPDYWQATIYVPASVRHIIGRRQLSKAFKASSHEEAQRLGKPFEDMFRSMIAKAQTKVESQKCTSVTITLRSDDGQIGKTIRALLSDKLNAEIISVNTRSVNAAPKKTRRTVSLSNVSYEKKLARKLQAQEQALSKRIAA